MTDDRLRSDDIIERLLDGDANVDDLEDLARGLRSMRAAATEHPVEPDHRLATLFEHTAPSAPATRPRARWLQRPAVVFGTAFAGVLVLGVFAFALGRSPTDSVAAPTTEETTIAPATPDAAAEAATVVSVPPEVGESVGDYLRCALAELGTYLQRRIDEPRLLDRPHILAECGIPAIPPLGEEVEQYRTELNEWLACSSKAFDEALPRLLTDPGSIDDPLEECGPPPNPADFDISFDLDLGFLDDLELPDLRLEEFLDRFRGQLPEDLELPEGFQFPDLEGLFDELRERLPEDLEGSGPGSLDLGGLFEDLEGALGDLEGLDTEQLERLWRELGEQLPDLDTLFDGFVDRLPDDFEFGDLELWFDGELFRGEEACDALQRIGLLDECDVAAGADPSA
jgi:hypothetical protein